MQVAYWMNYSMLMLLLGAPLLLLLFAHNALLKHWFSISAKGRFPATQINAYDITVMFWAIALVVGHVRHAPSFVLGILFLAMLLHIHWLRGRLGVSSKSKVRPGFRMWVYDLSLVLWVLVLSLAGGLIGKFTLLILHMGRSIS